jgi:phage major head subunit gpT-like protein
MCSASHTTKSGVSTSSGFGNYGTSALSKTSVAATRILFRKFRDDIGELYDSEPDTLLVPEALYDTACEIVGVGKNGATSMLDSASANNTINTLYKGFKVIPWRLLDAYSTKSWYMIDSRMAKKFLLWIDRVKPETATETDFHTFSIMQSLRARFGWGWLNWRWLYAHYVA